ncbi:MAG: hypothetical protein JNM88_16100 [Chitinophagaceae bacterium]|nr:hypothetical protein [Chitinophagaceae bacterium]
MIILLYIFLAYLLYQFIFKLVIPVYTTTRKIKKGFKEMNSRMEEQRRQQTAASQPTQPAPKYKAGEYIDFEDVK